MTELWVIVVAVGCFGADADASVVVDGDFQIGGMEFAVVGERQAVPVGTQPAEAVVCSVGVVDNPAGPGIVDEPGCGEGEYRVGAGHDGENFVVAVGLCIGAQQPVGEADDGSGLDEEVGLVGDEIGADVFDHRATPENGTVQPSMIMASAWAMRPAGSGADDGLCSSVQ